LFSKYHIKEKLMVKKTKKALFWMALLGFTSIALVSVGCASFKSREISEIQGKDWKLSEVRSGSNTVRIDRSNSGDTNIYSIRFASEGRVNGTAAPNLYFGPYTSGERNSLTIGATAESTGILASTRMASLFEREDLKEQEYFNYLNKVKSWALKNGKLELYTSAENGSQVVLIFS
jgi:heat shock protein HslJ